jgi:NAD(P)-dependent dehydrogenase (short-subunit alcohol dehydrogenase family)
MFDNINMEGNYVSWTGYGQSKTAMNWTANEIERRYGSRGLHAFSLHPGGIASGLQKYVTEEVRASWSSGGVPDTIWKTAEQGAATTVWAAVAKELEGTGGKYLEDCQVIGPWDPATGRIGQGYAPWVYDEEKATKLWEKSLEWVGEKGDN